MIYIFVVDCYFHPHPHFSLDIRVPLSSCSLSLPIFIRSLVLTQSNGLSSSSTPSPPLTRLLSLPSKHSSRKCTSNDTIPALKSLYENGDRGDQSRRSCWIWKRSRKGKLESMRLEWVGLLFFSLFSRLWVLDPVDFLRLRTFPGSTGFRVWCIIHITGLDVLHFRMRSSFGRDLRTHDFGSTSSSSERYEVSTGAASSAQNSPGIEEGFPIRVNLSIYSALIVTLRSLRLRFCLVVPLQSTQLQSISQLLFVTIFPFFTLSRTTC